MHLRIFWLKLRFSAWNSTHILNRSEQRLKQIRIVVGGLTLKKGNQPFEAHSSIDKFIR